MVMAKVLDFLFFALSFHFFLFMSHTTFEIIFMNLLFSVSSVNLAVRLLRLLVLLLLACLNWEAPCSPYPLLTKILKYFSILPLIS